MGYMFMKDLRTICVLCLLLLLTAGFVYSQAVNATLLGTVTDSSGAVVPNAKVMVTEVNTGGQSIRSNQRERKLHFSGHGSGAVLGYGGVVRVQERDPQRYHARRQYAARVSTCS